MCPWFVFVGCALLLGAQMASAQDGQPPAQDDPTGCKGCCSKYAPGSDATTPCINVCLSKRSCAYGSCGLYCNQPLDKNKLTGTPQLWVLDYTANPGKLVSWAYDDEGSRGGLFETQLYQCISVFHPPQTSQGVWYPGYTPAVTKPGSPDTHRYGDAPPGTRATALFVTGAGSPGSAGYPVANPLSWQRIWGLRRDGRDYSLYMPECPPGYVSMGGYFLRRPSDNPGALTLVKDITGIVTGAVATIAGVFTLNPIAAAGGAYSIVASSVDLAQHNPSPEQADTANLVCVHNSLVVETTAHKVWDDRYTTAQVDGSVWVADDKQDGANLAGFSPGSLIASVGHDDMPKAYAFDTNKVRVITAA